jgi:Papain-like cysteine protease AvrRpt2
MQVKARWIALAVLIASSFSGAQKPTTVGIPTAEFNFVSAAQLRTEWCWAASVQMILNWYDIPVKQSDVVGRIYGRTVDRAATEDAITRALSGTAYTRRNEKIRLHAERRRGLPPTNFLVDELGKRHPMMITFRSTRTMLHAVVVTSAEYEHNANGGVHVTALTFRDPNPRIKGRRPAGAIRLTGTELAKFVRSVSSYYVVDVEKDKAEQKVAGRAAGE